ncbi:hypothetical protein HNQ94_003873 [Salirhabdus euzebyi]|uniref:Multi-TM2 domain-containing protein n=1 Tax=Salirhabdus euzebyi TaxID=394506 RepID=A0A841QAR0_9BACI|nr:hypothetical protein [Salirhabdus euzebyi]MBB6455373.1 hypothetical protein [Salirhabdus euzebyi]
MNKSRALAFLLAFIPGFGHIYLNRKIRGVLYAFGFVGALGLAFVVFVLASYERDIIILLALAALGIWILNMFDMIMTLLMNSSSHTSTIANSSGPQDGEANQPAPIDANERFLTIILSFIPGVGHFHLGLNYRGLTFLAGFLGLGTMILFVTILTHQAGFLIFVLALPVIWVYNLFDTIQLLNRKQEGEILKDRSIMEDFEKYRESGKKSKGITTLLAMFPGAGHMYLGLQQRGLQLMIGFVLSIYVLDILRLSLFLFLIPVIWFFSFFDALQQQARYETGEAKDTPVFRYFINHQRWLGVGLILLGMFFIIDSILIPAFADDIYEAFNIYITYYYQRYLQMGIVCLLLIGGGIRLLLGSKVKHEEQGGEEL